MNGGGKILGIICIIVTCISSLCYGDPCDAGWLSYDNYCYKFTTTKGVTQPQASQECANYDTSLVRVYSTAQITWLTSQMKQTYPSSGFWTDLNDNSKIPTTKLGTSVWKWGSYQYADMSFISWNQSPANDGQSTCAGVNVQGKIADLKCIAKQGYICKQKTTAGCQLGWLPGNTGCYWFSNTTDPTQLLTWAQAKAKCASMAQGATLLILDSAEDTTFLQQQLPYMATNTKTHWIGLIYQNNKWGWYTNVPVVQPINWQKEPDNVAGIENCGILRMTGKFSDRDCSSHASFICMKTQYQWNPTDNIGCGSWIRAGKMCVHFSTGKRAWADARSHCQAYGADLIKVDSLDKRTWLNTQMIDPALSRVFWTGLNDRSTEGTYVWADGTPLNGSYVNWNQEPNDYKGQEDCGLIYSTGQYNDMRCTQPAAAICELDSQVTCPNSSWIQNGGNCYLFTPFQSASQLYTYSEAASFCSSFNVANPKLANLLSVDSKAEHDWIRQQVANPTNKNNLYGWWTSLNDMGIEGYWSFASGPLLDPTLIDWTGEPSTIPGDNCGMVNYGGAYHERDCTKTISFICEKYATGVTAGAAVAKTSLSVCIILVAAAMKVLF